MSRISSDLMPLNTRNLYTPGFTCLRNKGYGPYARVNEKHDPERKRRIVLSGASTKSKKKISLPKVNW